MLMKVVAYLQKRSPHLVFAAAPAPSSPSSLIAQSIILATATLATCGLGVFLATGATSSKGTKAPALAPPHTQEDAYVATCGPFTPGEPARLTMVSAPEKRAWIEDAYARFSRTCPNIQVEFQHLDDPAALRQMLAAGATPPSLWSPASSDSLALLAERWSSPDPQPFDLGSPRSLVTTPLVLLRGADEDGERPFDPQRLDSWAEAGCAPAPEAREGGRLWFVHPHPLRSSIGLGAIAMIAHDLEGDRAPQAAADAEGPDAALGGWFRRCEPSTAHLKHSPRDLTFRLGEARHPAVATSEHYAIELLDERSRDPELPVGHAVHYPETTIVHDHPIVVGPAGGAGDAAERWIAFLLAEESQRRAVEEGFRPAQGSTATAPTNPADNPFLRLRRHGIATELPSRRAGPLTAADAERLMRLWGDALGTS